MLLQRSLTPSKITSMDIDSEKMHVNVYLKPDQVSLAIGRKGVNIKLAQELTGYSIDVFRDNEGETTEFDIDLDEFSDEIETWIIDELKRIGCDTAHSVLDFQWKSWNAEPTWKKKPSKKYVGYSKKNSKKNKPIIMIL